MKTNLEKAIETAKAQTGINYVYQFGCDAFVIAKEPIKKPCVAIYHDGHLVKANWNLSQMVRNA